MVATDNLERLIIIGLKDNIMTIINKKQSHLVVFVKLEYVRLTLAHPITFSSSTTISCFAFTSSSSSDPTALTELPYKMRTVHNIIYFNIISDDSRERTDLRCHIIPIRHG